MCLSIKLGRHVNCVERMNSIDFRVHRAKVKVRMGIIDKCGVRGDAMICIVISYLLIYMMNGHYYHDYVNETATA